MGQGCDVNYYEHHLGDYAAATAHLSWDEDMAYTRLLRAYYHHERGIPQGQEYRLARAATPAQRKAVDTVLAEFFSLVEGVHVQKRADEEVARYQDKQRKAKASANARWSQSERNANASPNAMRTHSEGNAPRHQTPDTREEKDPLPLAGRACGYCGVEQSSVAWAFEWDHFIPKSAGGSDDESNRVWACHCCNQIKGGRIFSSVKAAAEYIHGALWAKNRARYEEPRRVCFGGKPPAAAGSVQGFPPGFEGFWSAYPRKTAKTKAAQAFARLRPDDALQAVMLAAVRTQAASEQWTREGGQFVPHAATWINGRRWEDEAGLSHPGNDPFAGAA